MSPFNPDNIVRVTQTGREELQKLLRKLELNKEFGLLGSIVQIDTESSLSINKLKELDEK